MGKRLVREMETGRRDKKNNHREIPETTEFCVMDTGSGIVMPMGSREGVVRLTI
jgi:hypothetical protein